MNFLIDHSIINAVSWTLIHSLWLGLATALLAGLTVLLTRKSTSAMRYNLLAALSVLFLVTIGFVFYNELETPEPVLPANKVMKGDLNISHSASFSTELVKSEAETPFSMLSEFISNYGSWIVLSWFLVFVFKGFRMAAGLRSVYLARNSQTVSPPEIWQKRLLELRDLLQIGRGVQLLESKLVSVPSVTGFFKPVILVPVGLLSNIPQDQVEAILLHELAHIRRSDYAVNLMQTFMEILFFFNPGILWVSSLLKDERENCCDDLAISVTNNKAQFVNALISFQEYKLNEQRFALQFGDRKMKLADRAKRILFNSNKMLSTREKYFLSFCVVMTTVLFLVVVNVNSSSAQENVHSQTTRFPASETELKPLNYNGTYKPEDIPDGISVKCVDEVKGEKSFVYIFKSEGVLYQVPQSLEYIKVNSKLISGEEREKHLSRIKELIADYETAVANEEVPDYSGIEYPEVDLSEEERIIDEASRIIDLHSAIIDKHSAIIDQHAAIIDQNAKILEDEANKESGNIDWKKHEQAHRRIEEAQRKIEAESKKINRESLKIDEQSRKIDEQAKKINTKLRLQGKEISRIEAEGQRTNSEVEAEAASNEYKDITKTVMSDLRKAGYKKKIRSFELNERSLIINGKEQAAPLYEKVKKYIKPGMRILYNIEVD